VSPCSKPYTIAGVSLLFLYAALFGELTNFLISSKHMKRHTRPYGCTYPKCNSLFGTKNDWKRHESSQHFQAECWRCEHCNQIFRESSKFLNHLREEHQITDNFVAQNHLRDWKLGRNYLSTFWCGFCKKITQLREIRGIAAWNERFAHIDEHFKNGSQIGDWLCFETNKFKKDDSVPKLNGGDSCDPQASESVPSPVGSIQHHAREMPSEVRVNRVDVTKETFECTFCLKKISSKSWKRHESQHVQHISPMWICMPWQTHSFTNPRGISVCGFCGSSDRAHLSDRTQHRISECGSRPESERAYLRKDHLKQHFRIFHDAKLDDRTAALWRIEDNVNKRTWPCGFCPDILVDWDKRALHIQKHFREGKTMGDWNSEYKKQQQESV
jgi:uncharacterized C2H2 Zn-finger protein